MLALDGDDETPQDRRSRVQWSKTNLTADGRREKDGDGTGRAGPPEVVPQSVPLGSWMAKIRYKSDESTVYRIGTTQICKGTVGMCKVRCFLD